MKTAVCTISANNFCPYGLNCLYSIKKFNDFDLFYLIADDFKSDLYNKYEKDITFVGLNEIGIPESSLIDLEFKYNIVEFNTSVKPAFYLYLFEKGYDNVIYFDPDMECYNNLNELLSMLEKNSVVLTPHKLSVKPNKFLQDSAILNNGTYNLGFIGMHKTENTIEFLQYWDSSLRNGCYLDYKYGNATDQIWLNLGPAMYEDFYISHHKGMNVAFWNFSERNFSCSSDTYKCASENLLFFHFSSLSVGCKDWLLKGLIEESPDFQKFYDEHIQTVKSFDFDVFSKVPYKFNFFKNGEKISPELRRFFGFGNLAVTFNDPFSCDKKSLYWYYKKNSRKLLLNKNNVSNKIFVKIYKFLGLRKALNFVESVSKFDLRKFSSKL